MIGLPDTTTEHTPYEHFPDPDTAATKTVAAVADQIHVIEHLSAGFDSAPDSVKTLTIAIGGTTAWEISILTAGLNHYEFPGGLYGTFNEAMVVTLEADAGGATGSISFGIR